MTETATSMKTPFKYRCNSFILFFNLLGSEKLTFSPDFKCRSEGLRFRAELRSRRKQTKTAFLSVFSSRLSVQAGARTSTEVRIMKKGRKMRLYLYGPNRGEGYRLGAFKCENEGVYNEVNDHSPNHEKRTQDAPLSLRTKPRRRVQIGGF